MLQDFRKFALRGNVVDMAVGIIVGGAFGTIAKSLVADILMPPLGLLVGGVDFADLYLTLQQGPDAAGPYASLAEAQAAGAVTVNYGVFVNNVLAFLIVAFAVFLLVRGMNRLTERGEEAPTPATVRKCPFCMGDVHVAATRCPHCTSEIPGEEGVAG